MPEPLLTANPNRFMLLPIVYHDLFKHYKNLVSVRWISEEIDLSKDAAQFAALTANEQHFISCVLGFFAGSDGIVTENIAAHFMDEVQVPEARAFYAEQISNEMVHNETYGRLIETYYADAATQRHVIQAIRTMPAVTKKAAWALRWMSGGAPFAKRLMAFAVFEGLFFSGSFAAIFWFKQRNLLPGLTLSNEFISRDEGLHTDFACCLYNKVTERLSLAETHALFSDAVLVEKSFILHCLPCALIGMNAALMSTYIEYVADRLLTQLGYAKLYGATNPFSFMERI